MANIAHSLLDEDNTLPVDFDGSCNPNLLPEVTFGPLSDNGASNMVTKSSSGRMSPIMACTMKEYDQKLDELKKENFNLKLRIYFLEEKIQHKFDGDSEQLLRTNIELRVDMENAKKDLLEKQDLLKKASTALETITSQREADVAEAHQRAMCETAEQRQRMERELKGLRETLTQRDQAVLSCQQELEASSHKLREVLGVQRQLNTALKVSEARRREVEARLDDLEDEAQPHQRRTSGADDLQNKDKTIDQLKSALRTKEIILEQAEEEKKEIERPLQATIASLQRQLEKRETEIQSLQEKVHDTDAENNPQQSEHSKDPDDEKENKINNLEKRLQDSEKIIKTHEDNALKRDKAIQGLAKVLMKKDEQILMLSADGGGDQLKKLESTLSRKNHENERLTKQLEKSEQQLNQREDALQDLRDALLKDKQKMTAKSDALENHYQVLLDDQQRQIDNQEKMVQRLTKSLQGKDKQIQDMIQAEGVVGDHDSRNVLLESLKRQLQDKERVMEELVRDQNVALDSKETELRQLKASVRQRDTDIERANQMLLTTEETIDTQDRELKEKEATMEQLAEMVKTQEKALQDAAQSHEHALADKESLIQRLRSSMAATEETLQDSVRQSDGGSDVVVQRLQGELAEREDLIQELLSDRQRTADVHDRTTRELLDRMRDRDQTFKEQDQEHQDEQNQLRRQIQNLQADLNKRDYELQTLENKATWTEESQQERLDKLRGALGEKDKTIETLVDSGREKDKVIRQLQLSGADGHIPESWQNAQIQALELQQLKDKVALQADAIQNKDALIERLESACDRLSPKPEMVPRARLRDVQEKLEETEEDELRASLASSSSRVAPCERCEAEQRAHSERPGHPQRTQTLGGNTDTQHEEIHLNEINNLIDALKTKHDVYLNITNSQAPGTDLDIAQAEAFEIELRAVQALRRQLEDGVQHNKDIRRALQEQGLQDGVDDVSLLRRQVSLLQTQLEESQRWSESLQARLQARGGVRDAGVGGDSDDGLRLVGFKPDATSGLAGFRTGATAGFKPDAASRFKPVDSGLNSGLKTGDTASGLVGLKPDAASGSKVGGSSRGVSPNNTWMVDNSFMPSFMSICRSPAIEDLLPGDEALSRMSPEELHRVIREMRDLVTMAASQQAASNDKDPRTSPTPREDDLQSQILALTAQLQHAENLNALLKRQLEFDARPAGEPQVNPQLMVEMAQMIEQLKAQKEERRKAGSVAGTENAAKFQLELSRAQSDISELQTTLASTEATVRGQAEKIKGYRRQLSDAGIVPRTPTRSRSESNIHQVAAQDQFANLEKFENFGQTLDVADLQQQIKELQNCLKRQVSKPRSRSVSSTGSAMSSDDVTRSSRSASGVSHIPVLSSRLRSTSGPPQGRSTRSKSLDDGSDGAGLNKKASANQKGGLSRAPATERVNQVLRTTPEVERLSQSPSLSPQTLSPLHTELSSLSQYTDELLHQDRHGDLAVIDITPGRVTELKQRLREVTRQLGDVVDGAQKDCPDGRHASSSPPGTSLPPGVDQMNNELQRKYADSQREITALRRQLDHYTSQGPPSSGEHKQALAILELENETLKRKIDSLQDSIDTLQSVLCTEREDKSSANQEALDTIKRLHKQLKGLKVKVTDAESQREAADGQRRAAQEANGGLEKRLTEEVIKRNVEVGILKEQIERMTGDVEERDQTVSLLRQRLDDLQDRQARHGPSPGTARDPQDRHDKRGSLIGTVSQSGPTTFLNGQSNYGSSNRSSITTKNGSSNASSQASVSDEYDPTSSQQTQSVKSFAASIDKNIGVFASREQKRKEASSIERMRHATAESVDLTLVPPLLSPDYDLVPNGFGSGTTNNNKAGSQASGRAGLTASQASTESLLPVSLQTQLNMAEELNETMQEIYDQVNQHETSISVKQRSPPAPCKGVTTATNTTSPRGRDPGPPTDLTRYLEEMHALRRKLEESISKNDSLRATLKTRANGNGSVTGKDITVNIEVIQTMKKEITTLTTQLLTRARQLDSVNSEVEQLRGDLQRKSHDLVTMETKVKVTEGDNQSLREQMERQDEAVRGLRQKLSRYEEEISKLQSQLTENSDLNKTLKAELSLYDKLSTAPATGGEVGASLEKLLLAELTQLRVQLERSIESNAALREKLEEHLERSPGREAGAMTEVHVNVRETSEVNTHHHHKTPQPHLSLSDLHSSQRSTGRHSNGGHHSNRGGYHGDQYNSGLFGDSFRSNAASETNISETVQRYNITDPMRPPGEELRLPNSPPTHDTDKLDGTPLHNGEGPASVRVSSDLRCLYALGALDDYELLKKQISQAACVLAGLSAVIASLPARGGTPGASPTSSPRPAHRGSPVRSLEGSTLRRVAGFVDNLQVVVAEQQRIVGLFWVSTMPQTDGGGTCSTEGYLSKKNYELSLQLVKLQKKYRQAKDSLVFVTDKLERNNNRREAGELKMIQALEETHLNLQKAKQNFTHR